MKKLSDKQIIKKIVGNYFGRCRYHYRFGSAGYELYQIKVYNVYHDLNKDSFYICNVYLKNQYNSGSSTILEIVSVHNR